MSLFSMNTISDDLDWPVVTDKEILIVFSLELEKTIDSSAAFDSDFHGIKRRVSVNSENGIIVHYELNDELTPLENRYAIGKDFKGIQNTFHYKKLKLLSLNSSYGLRFLEDFTSMHLNHFQTKATVKIEVFTSKEEAKNTEESIKNNVSYRQWVNEDPKTMTSIEIGKRMQALSRQHTEITFESFDESCLKKMNLNLLPSVGQGSKSSPPRLHIAKYRPKNVKGKPFTLIGKGITFDTGGINVKPFQSYVHCMKNDMGGAALAFHIFQALVKNDYPHSVNLVIPCCENLVGSESMKPGQIINSDGTDVIIEHTDAEGRLILADAIRYVENKMESRKIYTMATLTTAALAQYGPFVTPTYFLDKTEIKSLQEKSEICGESFDFKDSRIWFDHANRHQSGAITNMGRLSGPAAMGGKSNIAAHFLHSFCRNQPHSHFDIFNTVWNWSNNAPSQSFGATGFALPTLVDFFKEIDE